VHIIIILPATFFFFFFGLPYKTLNMIGKKKIKTIVRAR